MIGERECAAGQPIRHAAELSLMPAPYSVGGARCQSGSMRKAASATDTNWRFTGPAFGSSYAICQTNKQRGSAMATAAATISTTAPDLAVLGDLNRNYVRAVDQSDVRWFDENLAEDFLNS